MCNKEVKISIIIPVYNVERYLAQCLESVIDQALKEIEIICVNDGSTDHSLEILKHFEKIDSRIKVYSKFNAGYGHTINYALKRSHGKYIAIIDSDDYIDQQGLEKLYFCAEKNHADYVRSNFYEFKKGQERLNCSLDPYPYNEPISAFQDPSILYEITISAWSCIYLKEFLYENNIWMNETPGAAFQDTSWHFMVILRAKRIFFLADAFYHYRLDNPNSSTNAIKTIFYEVDEKNYMDKKIEEYQIVDPKILGAYARLIYILYKWNYGRIAEEFQYAFLLEWKKEIKKQQEKGYFNISFFEKEQWDEINQIVYETEFYFEKTAKIYRMKLQEYTVNDAMYYDAFVNKMLHNKFVVFGTGTVAKEIVCLLEKNEALKNVICFCETNPIRKCFFEKPVFSVKDFPYPKDTLLVCATMENIQKEIVIELRNFGFSNILNVDKKLRKME